MSLQLALLSVTIFGVLATLVSVWYCYFKLINLRSSIVEMRNAIITETRDGKIEIIRALRTTSELGGATLQPHVPDIHIRNATPDSMESPECRPDSGTLPDNHFELFTRKLENEGKYRP
ncbi:hypothetical protein C8J56DRAFT_1054512 [Mycena floridula]|nr:hypothetical protein C8J56DRAFT_1054512 [Mycena floridula]